jgi:hypothetical protein
MWSPVTDTEIGAAALVLSSNLLNVYLTLLCKQCGHEVAKRGMWFQSIRSFECEGCGCIVRLTYEDKVALFSKHAHLG